MSTPLRVLLVEDSEDDALLMLAALRRDGYEPAFERVQTAPAMRAALTTKEWDIILCDYAMPGFDALAALQLLHETGLELPMIIVSGNIGDETAVAAMKQGAADYLLKDRLARLGQAISQALEQGRLRREQKRAVEALKSEQALFNSLVSTIPDQIYFKDRESCFIRINDALARRFGLRAPGEALGKTDFDFFTEGHARQAYEDEQRVMRTGEPLIGLEEKETWPDGRLTWVSSTKFPLRDVDGKITGLVGISRDITARKQLEEQLRQAQKMEAIGQLSTGVAHDFNNLLTVIKGHIGLLRMKNQVSAEIAGSVQQIDEAADRASNLIRQLLTFSRQQVMQTNEHNLNGLVSNLAKMLRRLVSENIEMQVECAPQPLPIRADEGMVEQVLLNFAVNARDAMPKGGILRITTELVDLDGPAARLMTQARPGAFVCLAVSDTGTGIAPEILPRIFEPFFTTKGVGKGTGLGLATVYSVMQQHGGWVTVGSEVGRGTVFRAYFPRLASAAGAKLADKLSGTVRGGHEGILLVEDDPSVRRFAETTLTGLGYKVFAAPGGLVALQIWQADKHNIELLVTDMVMPDNMTGRELALRLRNDNPRLPVIYMSGYDAENAGADFPLRDGTNYLPKPFNVISLAKIVRASLDRGASQTPFAHPPK